MLDTTRSRSLFRTSLDSSLEKLRQYRQNRREFVSAIVGRWWSKRNSDVVGRKPLMLMHHAIETYVRALVARTPRVSITTEFPRLRPMALDAEVVVNAAIERFELEKHLTRWLRDAMIGFGILQVGLVADGFHQDQASGEYIPKGRLDCSNVSLDDWVHDMSARSLDPDQCLYYGNMFDEPLDDARENPRYKKSARLNLSASQSSRDTTSKGDSRTSSLGARNAERGTEYAKMWQFYFPRTQTIVVMPEDFTESTEPLTVEDWNGPERGPYHFSYFTEVPDSSLPLPPAALVMDLTQIADETFRKEAENTENAKTILAYRDGHHDDAQKVVDANNLDSVAMENPDSIREIRLNGPRSENMGFLSQAMTLWNMMAGNVNLVAGLGTRSPTLGQDQLLAEASNQTLGAMRDMVYQQVDGVLTHWCFYYWNDPLRIDQSVRQVPGTSIFVPIVLTPEQRRDEWARFNFRIEPYSLQRKTPQQRLAELDQVVGGIIMPSLAVLQQSGLRFDVAEYLRLRAKYSGMHELLDLVRPMEGDWQREGEIGQRPRGISGAIPMGGPRTYEHTSRSASDNGDMVSTQLANAAQSSA